MRLTIDSDDLAGTVGWVAGIIPGRASDAVAAGLRLDASTGQLTVSGSDYETSGSAVASAAVTLDGSVVVHGSFFADVVKILPRQPVTIELDGSLIVVRCSAARFTVPALPAGTSIYPRMPAMPAGACTIPAAGFAAAVRATAATVSADDALPVLTGVRAEFSASSLTLIGTDRYRMTATVVPCTLESAATPAPVSVPSKILAQFAKTAAAAGGTVTLGVTGDPGACVVGLSGRTRQVVTRSIAGAFPRWRPSFAQPSSFSIIVDASLTAEAVRRCSVAADNPEAAVRLAFSGREVNVGLSRSDGASGTETVPGVTCEGGRDFVIWFKPAHLIDALTAAGSKNVRLGVRSASGAVLFTRAPDLPGQATPPTASGPEPYRCLLTPKQPSP